MSFITELSKYRRQQYEYHFKVSPFLKHWERGPYCFLKSRLFMEVSALLVWILSKTRIRPNIISVAYALAGLAGGIFLAFASRVTIMLAVAVFFLKGILDWTDGHLARVKGETSITGAILDPYGALIGSLAFQIGLGFYVAQKSGLDVFYYLIPLIPLFYAARITSFSYNSFFYGYIKLAELKKHSTKNGEGPPANKGRIYNLIKNILDDRDRTIDFIGLLLLLEIFTPIFITWIVFLGFLIKQLIIFSASLYIVARGGWLEKRLEEKMAEISTVFKNKD